MLLGGLIHLVEPFSIGLIGLGVAALGIALLICIHQARTYVRFRGARVVTCPETRAAAGVAIDAWHAAATALHRHPDLRLECCSRWPERAGCGQECISQIESAPENCLVRNLLAGWYAGKKCALCKEPFAGINWTDHKPALLSPEGKTREWSEVRGEDLSAILDTHAPVCWRCHIMRTFCQEHQDLVLDRARAWPPAAR